MEQSAEESVTYITKRLPISFRDRLRILAAYRRTSLQAAVNDALAIGIPALEQEVMDVQRAAQQAVGGLGRSNQN
jgi:hypothetical protein